MKYLTFDIQGTSAYAKGKKSPLYGLSTRTVNKLISLGVQVVIWCNGDFDYIR